MYIIFIWRAWNLLTNTIYFLQAQEMENIILELMKIVSAEKILVEECGDLLSVVHDLQVKVHYKSGSFFFFFFFFFLFFFLCGD